MLSVKVKSGYSINDIVVITHEYVHFFGSNSSLKEGGSLWIYQ